MNRATNWTDASDDSVIEVRARDGYRYRLRITEPRGEPPEGGYPVIWLLDGHAFGGAVRDSLLVRSARSDATAVPAALLVAVMHGTPGGLDPERRFFDCTPGLPESQLPRQRAGRPWGRHGGAECFGALLLGEMRAAVAARYTINLTQQLLLAHSLAGLLAFDLFTRHPRQFANWQLISPSLWWSSPEWRMAGLDKLHRTEGAGHLNGIRITLSAGSFEEQLAPWESESPRSQEILDRRSSRQVIHQVLELAESLSSVPGLAVNQRIYENEDHVSTVFRVINDALRAPFTPLP